MKIEHYKELDALIADETNVKNIERYVATTEEGKLYLNYNRESQEYSLVLPTRTQKASDEFVLKLLAR